MAPAAYVSSAADTAITPEVAATVGHKWLGDSREAAGEVEPSTPVLAALTADLQVVVFWPWSRSRGGANLPRDARPARSP
ncbi:hypothetical protein ACFRJ8_05380 [Arthrobacter sp. NPDC056886]|uniref:hypothetical protein n=1 Tax=Arthrobacter sp. NPDC056886 TaxID=3345960 RepID=UPI00366A6291